jgi:hypothetical protein
MQWLVPSYFAARDRISFVIIMRHLFIFTLLVFFIGACSDMPTGAPLSTATSIIMLGETPSPNEMPDLPNMTIDLLNVNKDVATVLVGYVISIKVPPGFENITWQVDYADSVVQPRMPIEVLANPASESWFFRAVAVGQTDIRFTTKASKCQGEQPCPPAPPRMFVITINVVK